MSAVTSHRSKITAIWDDPGYAWYIKTEDDVTVVGSSLTSAQIRQGQEFLHDGYEVEGEFTTVLDRFNYLTDIIVH